MKLLILFLLGTVAFGFKRDTKRFSFDEKLIPEAKRRRMQEGTSMGGKRSLADYAKQQRDRCELLADDAGLDRIVKRGQGIIGKCPGKKVRSIVLIRENDTWVFTTRDPRHTYDDVIDFLRKQSEDIDDKHPIGMTYSYTTRDGQSRLLQVRGDMDLWAAFLLQEKFPATEVKVSIATIAPSAQPTTGTPSAVPTTGHPTEEINSRIFNADSHEWINSMLKKLNLYMHNQPLYRMTQHGRASSYFRAKCSYNGPWIVVFKTKNNNIFGGYNDIQWTNNGGSYFYCDDCFLWALKDRKYTKYKSEQYRYKNYATYHHTSYGPCFGGGHDMCMNTPTKSGDMAYGFTSNGYTYKPPGSESYTYYMDSTSTNYFYSPEWEVFPVYSLIGMNSRIVTKADDVKWLNSLLPSGKKIGNVCYRLGGGVGTTTKSVAYFRNGCSAKGPILFSMKTKNGNVFGAFSAIEWSKSSAGYQKSPNAFLWILKDKAYTRKQLKVAKNEQYATYMNTSYGPCFGGGHDMCVSSPGSPSGYGKVGNTYKTPDGKTTYYMDGTSYSFTLVDWEVHLIESE